MAVPQLDQKLDQRLVQLTTAKAETLAERAARFRNRTLTESEEWLDHIQRAKAPVVENDTQGLKELVGAWQSPVQVARVGPEPWDVDMDEALEERHAEIAPVIENTVRRTLPWLLSREVTQGQLPL